MQNFLRNRLKLVSGWYLQPFLSYNAFSAGLKKNCHFLKLFTAVGETFTPLTLSDFNEIWTVASLHHVLPPYKISWHLDNVKMPKLDLKVDNRRIEFLKNQLLCGDNAKLCRGGVNHDPKFFVGVVDDLRKKFQPLFSIFACQKKKL